MFKLEKIGDSGVKRELAELGLNNINTDKLLNLLAIRGDSSFVLKALENLQISNPVFTEGLKDLAEVVKFIKYFEIPEKNWAIDLTIARGLDYYTGTVYETILTDYPQLGSVCSGGRYDNLAEYYTDQKLPGVGISIGLTRLFFQLNELGILNKGTSTPTRFLVVPFAGAMSEAFRISTEVRVAGIPTEVFTNEAVDLRKKFEYANKLGIPFVGILGDNEVKENKITVKNMQTGEQKLLSVEEAIALLKL